jgi:hypothetical protein
MPAPSFPAPWETDGGSHDIPLPTHADLQPLELVGLTQLNFFVVTDMHQPLPVTAIVTGQTSDDPDNVSDTDHSDGDIRIKYHPSSHRELETFAFEDFTRVPVVPESIPLVDLKPWAPFRTREDFEFAELAQDARMTKPQVNKLIGLFRRCIESGDSFTLSSYDEMQKTLMVASERLPKVTVWILFCMFHIP